MPVGLAMARAAKVRMLGSLPKGLKVNGVGLTQVGEDYAVKVNLTEPPAEGVELPARFDGVPVVAEVVGRIQRRVPTRAR